MKEGRMEPNIESHETSVPGVNRAPGRLRSKSVRLLLCIFIIVAGMIAANYLLTSAPTASRRPPTKMAPLVQVQSVYPDSHNVVILATGTVVPAQEMVLKSRVSGQIVRIHPEFTEGGFLMKETEILKIDDADYQVAAAQKESAVVNARFALKLEQGRQEVAKQEWTLLNGENETFEKDSELALRKPHLEKAESDLTAAAAQLQQAELDLERTKIRAPFNALVKSTKVEIGSQISSQEDLAELVGTDEYWIKVSIPMDRLRWISIPRKPGDRGASARVFYRNGVERSGTVTKLLGDVETEGRMARILISVVDPIGLKTPNRGQPPLLIGEYVRVEIEGQRVESVYRIPRMALRDNAFIWIVGTDNKLQIRQVNTLWRDNNAVLIKEGLQPGERLVVSDLATPVEGMPLNIESDVENADGQPSPPLPKQS